DVASSGVNIIFVDINLPRMDGFEFADLYQESFPELRSRVRLYMLSGSINPADRVRAEQHPAISGFFEKPLPAGALTTM
ncbi:MAG: response regulator, partial [Pseudomonadota bacterium]